MITSVNEKILFTLIQNWIQVIWDGREFFIR